MIGSAVRALERFLLPNACVACGRLVESATADALVCTVCRSRLRLVPPGCERCRQPLPPVGPCRFCSDWPAALKWVSSAVWLGDEAREIVHHLKYGGYTNLGALAAERIAGQVPRPSRARLVPIPLSARRRMERGYNQAAEIARALGDLWKCPLDEVVLRRVRNTPTQTELSPEERTANVAGAFEAQPRRPALPRRGEGGEGERGAAAPLVILVDDVLTTGATLASAGAALQDAGWTEIGAVTFARAMPYTLRVEA